MKHDMFYVKPKCKKASKNQSLRGSWRNATNMCMGCYKFAAIPKLLHNKRDQD